MAANSNSFIRVRLFFDYPPPAIADCRMCWLLVDLNACRVVSDLESLIREKFEFSSRSILNLFVDDCYLPHTESVFVVRDNDSVRVKVDSLAQVNGHSSSPDPSSKNCRKRHRPAEDDGVSVEWKEKKRKKKREESLEREAKQVSGGKKSKKSKDKHAEKKKKKKEKEKTEDNIPVTPKSTAAAKKPPSTVEQPVKSIKKLPAVQGKTQSKKQIVSSSDSSSSSSEEHEAPKKTPALKPAPKTPSSTPAASKTPVAASKTPVAAASKTPVAAASKTPVAASKTPVATSKTPVATKPTQKKSQPTPSSSSETDSSSDEAAGAKVPPKHKSWNSTSQNSKPQQAPSLPPSSDCAQKKAVPEATPPPDGKDVETPKSDEEEEIQLVIRQPLQQPWRGMGVRPPWSGGSCGRTGSGGLGGRGRGEGRGLSRGHAADSFESSYNGAKEPSYQTDLLSNKSVILQNGAEVAPKKDYSSMPLLAAPPQVGQKIAFKLLELTENYTPEVSEYKEGRIVSFDPTTKQIELEILTVTQAPVEPGKFDLVYQNADGSESVEYAVPEVLG